MELQVSRLARACDGELIGEDRTVDGAGVDSRTIGAGQLFVAVRAERDGHDFAPAAVEAGAAALLVDHELDLTPSPGGPACSQVVVGDTVVALGAMGRTARQELSATVVGITGSVGKTSTKDLLAAVHREAGVSFASDRSLNNEMGVPLTLLGAPGDARHGVVEMGARGRGHIASLCEIASPDLAVVTRVAAAHTELFGTLDDVAVAKGELVESLPSHGWAVLNADDHRVVAMAGRTTASVITYATTSAADVTVAELRLDPTLCPEFDLLGPWGSARVRLRTPGAHNASNAAGAAAAAHAAGIDIDHIVSGLSRAGLSPHRMDLRPSSAGGWVLDDAYNANPASMRAALDALVAMHADRRVAVLGAMGELGDRAVDEHRAIGEYCVERGIELVAVGTEDYGVGPALSVEETLSAMSAPGAGVAVLVKASRAAGLEAIADAWSASSSVSPS